MNKKFYTYIIQTENKKLYCGWTTDIERRFKEHKSGIGAKYTRANKPEKVVFVREFLTKSEAMKEECRIKRLTKEKKIDLINDYENNVLN